MASEERSGRGNLYVTFLMIDRYFLSL